MARRSAAARGLFVLVLATAALQAQEIPEAELPRFYLMLQRQSTRPVRFHPHPKHHEPAEDYLASWFGAAWTDTNSALVLRHFFDPEYQAKLRKAASTGTVKELKIYLTIDDDASVRPPLWPRAVLKEDGRWITLGEYGMGSRSKAGLAAALLHEAGHLGDDSRCHRTGYGSDDTHLLEEVISPSGAFSEGWGNLQELLYAPDSPKIAEGYLGKVPLVDLVEETVVPSIDGAGGVGYRKIPPESLALMDFVANECFVANVLHDLTRLPGGLAKVRTAFVATSGTQCRTLYTFFGALVGADPALAAPAREIVGKWARTGERAVGSDAEVAALVEGRWPHVQDRSARVRAAAAVPTSGSGMFGQ